MNFYPLDSAIQAWYNAIFGLDKIYSPDSDLSAVDTTDPSPSISYNVYLGGLAKNTLNTINSQYKKHHGEDTYFPLQKHSILINI